MIKESRKVENRIKKTRKKEKPEEE